MNNYSEFRLYMIAQIHAIEKSKFIESQKACRDLFFDDDRNPSQKFFEYWIDTHGEAFRKAWPYSICRTCSHITTCCNCLKTNCSDYS